MRYKYLYNISNFYIIVFISIISALVPYNYIFLTHTNVVEHHVRITAYTDKKWRKQL